jgi:hypothetical protein
MIHCRGSMLNTTSVLRYSKYSKWEQITGRARGMRYKISSRKRLVQITNNLSRVTLAFEKLTPLQCCARFARGVGRPVTYIHGPIKISVSIPSGYREQLEALQETLGEKRAPYFGPDLEYPQEGRSIWEGYRGIEEYAREVFPIEEYANGLRWMEEEPSVVPDDDIDAGDAEDDAGLRGGSRPITPAGMRMPLHISGAYTPRSHPEGLEHNFFVGSV